MYKHKKWTRRRTDLELAFHPLLVFLPVLLFHLLVILNGLDEFRLDQCGLLITGTEPRRLKNEATQENDATQH